MAMSTCDVCAQPIDEADNFCRQCGAAAHGATLPVRRADASITLWRPQASPVVKGAAVMAAGTLGQFLFRRAVRTLLTPRPKRPRRALARRAPEGFLDEAQVITETVMMRRVRILRRA